MNLDQDEETPTPTPSPSPASTPPPSPTSTPPSPTWGEPHTPESTPLPPLAEEEETELGGKPEEKPSKWGPPQELVIKGSESVDLQTLNSMLTKNKDNPDYVVKSPKSKFHGYTMADIKKARDEILDRRKKGIKLPQSYFTGMEPSDEEMEGSGTSSSGVWGSPHVDPNVLVEQLHLSLASIRAGNTSLKLKKQVEYMLGFLEAAGEITQKEVHNILRSII